MFHILQDMLFHVSNSTMEHFIVPLFYHVDIQFLNQTLKLLDIKKKHQIKKGSMVFASIDIVIFINLYCILNICI